MLGNRLSNLRHPPDTLNDLRLRLQEAWHELPQAEINHLIENVPRRVNESIIN